MLLGISIGIELLVPTSQVVLYGVAFWPGLLPDLRAYHGLAQVAPTPSVPPPVSEALYGQESTRIDE